MQENNGKVLKKGNVRTSRALSVGERPGGEGDREEEKQMAKISK